MPVITVQTTVLPNGGNGNKINFTVLLTPAIDTPGQLPELFEDWPSHWNSPKAGRDWTLSVTGVAAPILCRPVPVAPSSDLWNALFQAKPRVRPRQRNNSAAAAWLLSHKATHLHNRHSQYRALDSAHRIARHNPQLISKGGPPTPEDAQAAVALSQDLETLAATVEPENVYLFSSVTKSQTQTPVPVKQMFVDRQTAIKYTSLLSGLPYGTVLMQRINHGQTMLENEEDEELTGPALFALYRHCVNSIGTATNGAVSPQDPKTVMTDITAAACKLVAADGSVIDDKTFNTIQNYVELHLFSKRPIQLPRDTPRPPDFHEFLGMLHQYPTLLRPLGLAVDFQGVDASFLPSTGSYQISIMPPTIPGISNKPANASGEAQWQSLYTQCASRPAFAAQSLAGAHKNGFLDISDEKNFAFVTEDSDGSSQKLVQQKAARARGMEFDSSAPTGLPVSDNRASRSPTRSLPSARTTGIALYQGNRADQLAQSIARNDDKLGTQGNPLHIEDITLGYRVDVRNTRSSTWYSLHRRKASYAILSADGKEKLIHWPPSPTAEEGFITLAATSTTDPNVPTASQIQVHQAIFTWTGWSLSVPRPPTKPFNDAHPNPSSSLKTVSRVRPTFEIETKGTLPKLRFENSYEFRLRQVDLVGNSLPYTTADAAGTSQIQELLRHEPIRAPQILVEEPIDRHRRPSEHVDIMVSRDGSASPDRVLVPPRETHYLAELHGFLDNLNPIPTAFSRQHLMTNGAFPSVAQIFPDHAGLDSENQDGVFKTLDDPISQKVVPETPYLPDPLAILSRIEPYTLANDLQSYVALLDPERKTPYQPLYPPFLADTKWPDVLPIYIRINPSGKDESPRIRQEELPLKPFVASVAVFGVTVDLPKAATVMLQITSASNNPSSPPLDATQNGDISFLVMPEDDDQRSSPGRTIPTPPLGQKVNLFQTLQNLTLPGYSAVPEAPIRAGENAVTPITGEEAADVFSLPPAEPSANPAPTQNLLPPWATSTPVTAVPSPVVEAFKKLQDNLANNQSLLTNGSLHTMTPPRKLTLVHAVKKPLDKPAFERTGQRAEVVNFCLTRAPGESAATITGKINAHWLSTSKVTITAKWSDRIDDLTKASYQVRTTREVATEVLNDGKSFGDFSLIIAPSNQHRFRDTRAHSVTYSLSAFTRFREYYPGTPDEPDKFSEEGESCTMTVLSSARPPAPTISYIIPAFSWKDCDGLRGRAMALRVYLERPFLVSGDKETVGVVLLTADPNANATFVSQWGADPIVTTPGKIASNNMKVSDFIAVTDAGSKPERPRQSETFRLAEKTGTADVLPFNVDYAEERGLWYCDVPLSPSQTESAFARLALIRWQPDSLNDDKNDFRASQVVFADFIQVRADRWVYFERQDAHNVKVSVSGIFRTADPAHTDEPIIRCRIQQRWHRLGDDDRNADWRPFADAPPFMFQAPETNNAVGAWYCKLPFKHSTNLYKYRLVIEEKEYMQADQSKEFGKPLADKRVCRYTYLHYIEL